jgi:hypothetical protein
MLNGNILLTAATLALTGLAGSANAASWDHRADYHPVIRHEIHRSQMERIRVYDNLRMRHYRGIGDPFFVHGHYVVRGINRFGRIVFVEVNPRTGAFMGEIRL